MKTRLILDINKTQYAQLNSIVTGRVGDKASIPVDVYVVDGFIPYNLTGSDVYFECAKPDNTSVRDKNGITMIDAAKGHFEYTFPTQTFASVGKSKQAYFSIEKNSTVKATTQDFIIVSLPDALTNRIPSKTYISQLDELIKQLEQMQLDVLNSEAYREAHDAKEFAEQANELSISIQKQLDTIVINGDSSVEAAQAREDEKGFVYSTLRTRLNTEKKEQTDKIKRLNKNLEDISVNVDDFLLATELYDDEAIKRAIDYAVLNKKRHVRLAMRSYKITKTLEIDVSYVCLISSGAIIDATAIIEGKAIFVKGTIYPPYSQSVDALVNIELIGKGRTNNTIGIYFSSENASSPSHISLRNINIHGFGENVHFGNKSYVITFYACDLWDANYCVVSTGTIDAGERYTFIGSTLYNSNNLVKQNNQNSSIKMVACSLDYQSYKSVEIENGRVSLIGCHIEAGSDNDYWFSVKNNGSLLQLTNCEIFVASERNNFELGYCNESVKLGGIDIRDCFISMARYKKQLLIEGNGRVSAKNIKMFELDKKPGIAKSLNVLRDGSFNTIDALLDWDIPTETKPTIVNEGKITPVCLKFQADNGKSCSMKKEFPIYPGELFSFSFWIKTQNLESSGKQFFVEISYLDEKNNILYKGGSIFSKDSDWNLYTVQNAMVSPPGVRKVVIGFNTGAWLNTCSVWIDEVIVNVY